MMCQKHTQEQTNFRSSFPISVKVKAAIEVRKRQEITFLSQKTTTMARKKNLREQKQSSVSFLQAFLEELEIRLVNGNLG